ncbi:RiPP maturation radical SAM protein 1 [Actinoplanes sp. OR16]|uniref:RiPP maturation radical SAM C-methyltransferase n=1 Tax=Actinoplanes sp. OR16 TaxID=946334 RepID=UPI000F703656|nr:RiPP maturation radical SAM C-methyltransferase [Actinoplanes sp. OR16]BBH70809.1 RiPP maturation radical SAM protein 1 [Actinoplanes sp. OR16]
MRTVLVSMPFMDIDRPSIQLGLLKAIGERNGFAVRTLHANLDFAARIGVDQYRELAETRGSLVGDWLFSVEAFGEQAPDPAGRLPDELGADPAYGERLRHLRDHDVPAFLDSLMDAVAWTEVRVVGFSCTFQQNTASFALARRLKRRFPHLVTVFGGANFDGEMGPELVRTVDCIDLAVSGEADTAFPRLLAALAAGTDPAAVPGVCRRAGDTCVATPPEPPYDELDDLPPPDYGEYFERAELLGVVPRAARRQVWLPFESARGCWWGERHHCTFCGLNGTTMPFRSKSPARVLDELAGLAHRYGTFRFEAVDNILDPRYLRELFPAIADTGADYEFFYEAKANLTRAQLRVLARGGVSRLQPGLESLSSTVLRLMDKGVRAAQNVNLLRWARYYGIDVAWSILWGFPGESAEDYADQAAAVPHLRHLQPPEGSGRIWLERFSPLFARQPGRCVPEIGYRYIYPKGIDLDRVAYFFDHEIDGALPDSAYEPLRRALADWAASWRSGPQPSLTYRSAPGVLQINDTRHAGYDGTYTFEGVLADIYLACTDRPITAAAVRERLEPARPIGYVAEVLDEFHRRGLVFRDDRFVVALALPATPGR